MNPAPYKTCGCCGATFATREAYLAGTEAAFVWPADSALGLPAVENRHCLSCPEDYRTTLAIEVQS